MAGGDLASHDGDLSGRVLVEKARELIGQAAHLLELTAEAARIADLRSLRMVGDLEEATQARHALMTELNAAAAGFRALDQTDDPGPSGASAAFRQYAENEDLSKELEQLAHVRDSLSLKAEKGDCECQESIVAGAPLCSFHPCCTDLPFLPLSRIS